MKTKNMVIYPEDSKINMETTSLKPCKTSVTEYFYVDVLLVLESPVMLS